MPAPDDARTSASTGASPDMPGRPVTDIAPTVPSPTAPDATALPDPFPTITVDGLTLRPLAARDEAQARAAVAELSQGGFAFLMGYEEEGDFTAVREAFARDARGDTDPRWVRSSMLAAEDAEGALVGRVSVRWELNEGLRHVNGHVGYAVRPGFRRRGHARRMLRGALALLHAEGVETALVTCDESNAGSVAVVTACGGVLRDRVHTRLDGTPKQDPTVRFDVPTAPLP